MNTVVVGAYWGDEGKGKIVDFLCRDAEWVARFNGGDNAGHTIVFKGNRFPLHLVPSGVFQGKELALGPGVLINPETLCRELGELKKAGFSPKLHIDARANVIMPYHVQVDSARETSGSGVGSTRKGIGPCMEDAARRSTAVTMGMLAGSQFRQHVERIVTIKYNHLKRYGIIEGSETEYAGRVVSEYAPLARKLVPFIVDDLAYRLAEVAGRGKLLVEGAQGALLDREHGTKPHQTSTNTTAEAAFALLGMDGRKFRKLLIVKAYPSRVGGGPFPTRLGTPQQLALEDRESTITEEEKEKARKGDAYLLGKWIRKCGREYGTTTGRAREVGYPDLVALRYSVLINGMSGQDGLALTLADVLGGIPVKLCTAYEKAGKRRTTFPASLDGWQPVYGKVISWQEMDSAAVKKVCAVGYAELPDGLREYCRQMVQACGVPVEMISLGKDREETLTRGVREATEAYLK